MRVHQVVSVISPRRDRPWSTFSLLCAAAVCAYLLMLAGSSSGWGLLRSLTLDCVLTASTVAVLVGIRRYRPEHPAGWYLAALALALASVAHLVWGLGVLALGAAWARTVAEALYLACYPFGAAALVLLLRQRNPGHDRAGVLDALVFGIGLALLSWPFLIEPFLRHPGLQPATRLHGMVAPLFDIGMLVLLLRLAAGRRVTALRLVIAGISVSFVTDALFALRRLPEVDDAPALLELGWVVAVALLGVAALHPSMRLVGERAIPPQARLTRGRIALLLGIALASMATLAVLAIVGLPVRLPLVLVGCPLMFVLVLARMHTLAEQEHARSELQELVLDRIVQATEQERNRIAADLHDGPIQRLARLPITAAIIRNRFERGDAAAGSRLLTTLEHQVSAEIQTLRQLMAELRPPVLDEWGLEAALAQCASEFTRRTGTVCTARTERLPRLDASRETVVYRVVQEALNNVAKHARAQQVDVLLGVNGQTAHLEIRDDGVGFEADTAGTPPDHQHFGLVSMRQRVATAGGTFTIRSNPGDGTTITVHLPLPAPALQ